MRNLFTVARAVKFFCQGPPKKILFLLWAVLLGSDFGGGGGLGVVKGDFFSFNLWGTKKPS